MVGVSMGFTCELVTWEEQYRLARILAEKIRSSGFRPDLVIAVGRGGYVPARIVCDLLLLDMLTSVKVEHWGKAAEKKEEAVIRFPLCTGIRGKRVLIVDDVTDTGDTFRVLLDYVKGLGPLEVRTAVLHHKEVSPFIPDYHSMVAPVWRWIIYPWALHEDLVGFSRKVLADGPLGPEEIRRELSGRYGISVEDEDLSLALRDLVASGEVLQEGEVFRLRKP